MLITQLPRDVLQRIFANEDVSLRCALACSCTYFRDLSLRPGFWEVVNLDVGSLQKQGIPGIAAMLHFLAKRISAQTKMALKYSAQPQDPFKPQEAVGSPVLHLLAGVGITRGLAKLSLDLANISMPVQTQILDILPFMTSLRELAIHNICMANTKQLNALSKLAHIETLVVDFSPQAAILVQQTLQGGFPAKLAALTQLRQLNISRAGYLGSLPEEISNLSSLESLSLSSGSVVTGLPQSFSALNTLTSVALEHFGSGHLAGLAWLPQLCNLRLSSGRMPVELASCGQLTALTLLLAAVPEHQIEIGFSRMLGFSPQAEEWQALLPPQQERAARLGEKLRALRIANTKLGSVPQAITQLPNLNHLSLTRCSLFNLPAGPYIRKLTTLELKCNFFIEIPQRLRSCAVELQHLDLSYNLLLKPSDADIETVLRLPSLRHLWVTKAVPQSGPERIRQGLNSWTAYSMDCLFKLAARHAACNPGRPLNVHIFEPPGSGVD